MAKADDVTAAAIASGIISTAAMGTVAGHVICLALETNIVALRAASRSTAARRNVFPRLPSVKSL